MKSTQTVITSLNEALKGQLTLINQTFLHARMAKNWGLEQINEQEYKASIVAMKRADDLIERVLFLESLPAMQSLDRLAIGESVAEFFSGDLKVYSKARQQLLDAVATCEADQDFISREVVMNVLEGVEEHIDWLETQQWQMSSAGTENYIAAQMED